MRAADQAGQPIQLCLLDYQMPEQSGEQLAREITQDRNLKQAKLILLTSTGQRGDAARMKEAGFSGYLLKPIKQSMLLECITTVLGTSQNMPEPEKTRLVTQHSLKEAQQRLRFLLVEDNPVNQKVAVKLLEKVGYYVDVVNDGIKAVEAVGSKDYDMVLMDCQMPVMDGFEATAAIRLLEGVKSEIPIVAMTASATVEDRERCLEAGMNECLYKPIDPQKLFKTIEHYTAGKGDREPQAGSETTPKMDTQAGRPSSTDEPGGRNTSPIDIEASIARAGDKEFWQELMSAYFEETEKRLEALSKAIADQDTALIEREAHTIKGGSAEMEAMHVRDAALALEQAGQCRDLSSAPMLLEKLKTEYERLQQYLRETNGSLT
jgi:CheY-like chemotaxis protein